MSKTTSDYLGLTLRDNNEFVDTEVDAENFRKIDGESEFVNENLIVKANFETVTNSQGNVFKITRPRNNSPLKSHIFRFTPDKTFRKGDKISIDGNYVSFGRLGTAGIHEEDEDYLFFKDVPTIGIYESGYLYLITANPVIRNGSHTFMLKAQEGTGFIQYNEPLSNNEMIIEAHRKTDFVKTLATGVSCSGDDIVIEKIGPLVWALGVLNIPYAGQKMTLLTLSQEVGGAEGIDVCHFGVNDHFLAASTGTKIARLEWKKSTDGTAVSLVLDYIWDLATGKQVANGTYSVAIDSHFYAGYTAMIEG